MREVKFRAWDGKEIIHLDGLILNPPSRNVLMQYTGLKDKYDTEIYEGDIIRRYFEVGQTTFHPVTLGVEDYDIKESGHFVGVVSFRPTEGWVLNKCRKYADDGELVAKRSGVKIYAKYAEVIGNIYENPELLEVAE